jgi:hypothetical protein
LLPHDIAVDDFADRWSAERVHAEVDRLIEAFESNPDGAEYFARKTTVMPPHSLSNPLYGAA